MDMISASEAARRLRTNLPRLQRAVRRLGLPVERGRGGRLRLDERQLERLAAELGVVEPVEGLSRVETQVLAALARAPRGLASARAVARRAGVSPTAASAALRSLAARGLVRTERQMVAAGRARRLELVRADTTAPEWHELADRLAVARLPEPTPERQPSQVPGRLAHLFWNADLRRLDPREHGGYVAERLLSSGDLDGLAWGAAALVTSDWEQAARSRGLSPQQRALAHNLARRE